MIHRLAYGRDHVELCLDHAPRSVLLPDVRHPGEGEMAIIRRSLAQPVGSPPLRDLVSPGERVVVVISDLTRLWVRQHLFIPEIIGELLAGGVRERDITLLAATGDHRGHREKEWPILVGEDVPPSISREDHDARNDVANVPVGTTSRGTPVAINQRVLDADRVVLTGGIVYHFLAGFSGGMKALLPGVAAYETIMANHSLALADGGGLQQDVAAGKMEGNPCSEDIWEGGAMIGPDFCFNVIVDDDTHRIVDAVAGEVHDAHRRGREAASERWGVAIDSPAEVVLASSGGYPKDINLYQTYKTLYGARRAVCEGGTVVIVSQCSEGMGNDDFAAMLSDHDDNELREAKLREHFTIGGYMAYHASLMAQECDVALVSDMPVDEVRSAGMMGFDDLARAMEFVREKHGDGFDYYMMPSGSIHPVIGEGGKS
ncbi:MAG: nickel-dependent lactate racemase [Clostridia bacterium]